jgi:hypothetical protein
VFEVPAYLVDEYEICTRHVPAASCERGIDSPSAQSIDVAERVAGPVADRLRLPSVAVSVQVPLVSTTPVTPAAAVMAPAVFVPHLVSTRVACSRPSAADAVGVGTGGSVATPSPGSLSPEAGAAEEEGLLDADGAVAAVVVAGADPVAVVPAGSVRPDAMSPHSTPPAATSSAAATATTIRIRRECNTFEV